MHCAAGKDRTGLICALTHHVLGVSEADIMADYLLTNDESRMARKMGFLGPWLRDTVGKTVDEAALRVAVLGQPGLSGDRRSRRSARRTARSTPT